jgi:hypothetical protein
MGALPPPEPPAAGVPPVLVPAVLLTPPVSVPVPAVVPVPAMLDPLPPEVDVVPAVSTAVPAMLVAPLAPNVSEGVDEQAATATVASKGAASAMVIFEEMRVISGTSS